MLAWLRLIGLVAAASLAQGAAATGSAAGSSGTWQVDWGEQRCTLLRKIDGDRPMTLALRLIPGNKAPELILVDPGWKRNPLTDYQDLTVTLGPDGPAEISASGLSLPVRGAGRSVMVDRLPEEFNDLFARSTSLQLARSGEPPFASVAYSGAQKAIEALMDCNDGLLKSWGFDVDQAKKLKKAAQFQSDNGGVFKPTDYPLGALDKSASGTVVIAYDIKLDGRASDCRVVGSSGNSELDRVTCEVLIERAKYSPAIGPDDRPVESKVVLAVHWTVRTERHP